ncbi:XRE family transcriptional regulator [Amycolatopsis sp. NPDC059027]|uniref:XRE family transcriptional regulator n=1 Tax=unclassified Amycolatopsis TaxID=2618356 RepID=UPI003670678E
MAMGDGDAEKSRASGPGSTLADRLNYLFDTVQDGRLMRPYTNGEVARAVVAAGGSLSENYLWMLRNGQKDNPTFKHLKAIADFFGVPAGYFFDDAVEGRLRDQLAALKAATGSGDIRLMASRAGELSPENRRKIVDMVDMVYRLERGHDGRDT